jgi:hypothetical protein
MKKPNWQIKFRDLPEIPEIKKWIDGQRFTKEQEISFKLLQNQEISETEGNDFKQTFQFYESLNLGLQKLDYASFNESDFENFKNYINYAFNYTPLLSNKLTVYHTYRLVVNEWVSGINERISHTKYLKYPTLDIVKKIGKYNRANTPSTNVLYTAENIDTALKEIKPPTNKIITVGHWKPITEKEIISFPISHSESAIKINEGVQKSTKAFEEYGNYNSQLFVEWSRHYFKLLGREFTKPVNHHYEYLISALLSERVFSVRNDPKQSFNFECIIYPSVGNNFGTDNLAIHPHTVDKKFRLHKIIEFEIEETYYEKDYVLNHPEIITLAKVKNVSSAKKIIGEQIIW